MTINGRECLIICFVLLLMGDTPALKAMCGYSTSVSSACYVRMPCRCCDILMESLFDSIIDGSTKGVLRSLDVMRDFYRSNGNNTGAPKVSWLQEQMKRHGILRIPELILLHMQPDPIRMGLDFMHSVYLGVLRKHFIKLVKILVQGDVSRKKSIWREISMHFTKYCRLNNVPAFYNFNTKKEFKLRMTAGSMKEFMRASGHILMSIGIAPSRNPIKQRAFYFWTVHVKIASILNQHCISQSDVGMLDSLVPELLTYFATDFPKKFFTINVHYYVHIVEQVKAIGPLRFVSNFSREALIRMLKPAYRNINTSNKEVSIFKHYFIETIFYVAKCLQSRRTDDLRLKRNHFPEGLIPFDFELFDKVILETDSDTEVLLPFHFENLEYSFNNLKGTVTKINYQTLRQGDYICVSPAHNSTILRIGIFQGLLRCNDDEHYLLAFTTPLEDHRNYDNENFPLLSRRKISTACTNEIYIVPVDYFMHVVQVCPEGEDSLFIIMN